LIDEAITPLIISQAHENKLLHFFRKLGGKSGTARETASEFWHFYKKDVDNQI
jgi:preprotein translocase subunit SecA